MRAAPKKETKRPRCWDDFSGSHLLRRWCFFGLLGFLSPGKSPEHHTAQGAADRRQHDDECLGHGELPVKEAHGDHLGVLHAEQGDHEHQDKNKQQFDIHNFRVWRQCVPKEIQDKAVTEQADWPHGWINLKSRAFLAPGRR